MAAVIFILGLKLAGVKLGQSMAVYVALEISLFSLSLFRGLFFSVELHRENELLPVIISSQPVASLLTWQ